MGLGVGAFVPSALALMADSSDASSYGATMGLYSFALGFGAFIAQALGLVIVLFGGNANAPTWLLYLAIALITLAVMIMASYFLLHQRARKLLKGQA
jgi:MFS family permease